MNNGDAVNNGDAIDQRFTDAFNHANDLFLADRLVECEAATFALLREETIPRYHRMRALILLGTIVGDWEEAKRYHVAAEAMWRNVRRYHPEGANEEVEKHIAELRELLDDLDVALRDDAPSEYGLTITVKDGDEEHDSELEDAEEEDADIDTVRPAT
jgi:predicted hydrolase (HD superfamily)